MACGASGQGAGVRTPDLSQPGAGPTQPAPTAQPGALPVTARAANSPTPPLAPTVQLVPPTSRPRPSPIPQPPKPTALPTAPAAPPASATASVAGAWPTYRNAQGGYRIAYPPDWTVSARSSEDGAIVTAFAPPGAGPGITVAVQAGAPPSIEPPENDTRRCARVVVASLTGTRCSNTTTATTSTTLAGKGKTYIIATTGKGLDDSLYQRFLDSFAPVG